MHEKRKYVRVHPDPDEPIEIQVVGGDFFDILQARNISEGGLKIEVPHLFDGSDIGSPVQLIVTLPRKRSFKATGQVKHTAGGDSPAFGVKFIQLEPQHRAWIADYVESRIDAGAAD